MKLSNLLIVLRRFERSMLSLKECIEKPGRDEDEEQLKRSDIFYNGIIITAYGQFESYIDELSKEYLDCVFTCEEKNGDGTPIDEATTTSIRKKLVEVYRANMGDFLLAPKRHSYIDSSNESICQILSSYLEATSKSDYSNVNKSLLIIHGGNMKSDLVIDLFSKLQIPNIQCSVVERKPFKKFLNDELGIEENTIKLVKNEKSSDIYLLLNQLVEERNKISHQGKSDNKISLSELSKRIIPFLLCFADAIFKSLCEFILSKFILPDEFAFQKAEFIDLFDNRIICHSNEGMNICVGDYLVVNKDKENSFLVTKIQTIQENHVPIESTGNDVSDFGFEVDERINDGYTICKCIGLRAEQSKD